MRNHLKIRFSEKGLLFRTPGNGLIDKAITNTAVMITLVAFLFMISGCNYYRSVTIVNEGSGDLLTKTVNKFYPEFDYPRDQYPLSNLYKMFFVEYHLYLVDSIGRWELSEADIKNDTVYATVKLLHTPNDTVTDIPGDGISVKYKLKAEGDLLMRVFIYSDKVDFIQGEKAYFSVNDISKVITFRDHPAAKVGYTFLVLGGVLTITVVTLIIIALGNWDFKLEE
jgi:hypothetical protein